MPVKTNVDKTIETKVANRWRLAWWQIDHSGGRDKIILAVEAGKASGGTVAQWHDLGRIVVQGATQTRLMASAGTTYRLNVATLGKATAMRVAIRNTLYDHLRSVGSVPTGTSYV